ncbi:MAG TPA: Maf family protein [Gammaproteobacteria bacterium]|nr:Maf family protein [Gammaproteobacteria bacterium]
MSGVGSAMLLLASRSPRRAELLRTLGVAFAVIDVEVDESPWSRESSAAYVRRLARMKAEAGRETAAVRSLPVLAADTTVVLDGAILGKPRDANDARAMLRRLGGRAHEVLTGVALIDRSGAIEDLVVVTRVAFRALEARSIDAYVASGEPADKAGAYAIQGLGGALVERIDGSYSNVVGLPLAETLALLDAAGVPHALSSSPSEMQGI